MGHDARARLEWTQGLDFEVPVLGQDVEDLSEVDYLYWVGCAGALEDRAKKTTRAFAELLHIAGVRFAVLGEAEACSGDPARRLGNEFVFQMLAQQNVETLNEAGRTRPSSSRPARTASTPSAASTPSSAATTRSSTTPSCWTGWSRRAGSRRSPRSTSW